MCVAALSDATDWSSGPYAFSTIAEERTTLINQLP